MSNMLHCALMLYRLRMASGIFSNELGERALAVVKNDTDNGWFAMKIIDFLLKSAKAANVFPEMIQVAFDALYGMFS